MSITTTRPGFPCCPKPDINSMMKAPDVNAVCCNCGVHWYGTVWASPDLFETSRQ